jgi:hypothetical protein
MKYIPSTDKTESDSCWNNFSSDAWAEFKKCFPDIKFVDVIEGETFWKNEEDTVVFIINNKGRRALPFAYKLMNLCADEFDYIEVGKNKHIVRLWWD